MADAPAPAVPAAAPSSPAPAPAPANEAVINPNPGTSPEPTGAQTVEKSPAEMRRASIQKAFERANKPPPAGHNKPPVETPKEKAAKPAETPQETSQGPQRGEKGRFAPRQATIDDNSRQVATDGDTQPGVNARTNARPAQLPETAPYREPPTRMAEHAKAEWAAAPESIRGEVHRITKEAEAMYRAYRPDHDEMNKIRHFHEMATQHGTTLDRALTNYTSMEHKLRGDVIGGLDIIVNNLGLKRGDGSPVTLRDIAYHIATQSPEALNAVQQRNASQAANHQIGSLHEEIAGLKNEVRQMHTATQFNYTRSAVDQFAEQPGHERFDELGDLIEQELSFGYDLNTAYTRASLLRPASTTHAAQTRDPPAQTRTDKSISGSPEASGNGAATRSKKDKPVGRREAIQNAIRRVNGSFA